MKSLLLKKSALNYFCDFFVKLLFSGFDIEGIDHKDIVQGNLYEKWSIWPTDFGKSSITQTHSKIRMSVGSKMDTIHLANPRIIKVSELKEKIQYGNSVLEKTQNLTPKFLLRGITEFRYKNWDLVLSNESFHPVLKVPNRKKSMKDDSRTWSASVKQEILFQSKILNEEILLNLNKARKNRNKLVHEGKAVSKETASSILDTTIKLIQIISNDVQLVFLKDRNKRIEKKDLEKIRFDFNDWQKLPDSNIIESVLGDEVTQKIKK